ncbi:MAG: lytic transglycosylase domain-containing protein, partial [Terriglobales bacterium]
CCALLALSAMHCSAADLAVLRNGFSIRHDHHVMMGKTTRLFMSADNSSFTDVATADISGFEPAPAAAPSSRINSALPQNRGLEGRETLGTQPARQSAAADLKDVVNSASSHYHLDPDLVNSVIHAESGFNVHAVSPKGARGLMQLMPRTASELGVKDAFDSEANVGGGSRYLRELLERYNFDLIKALAAYNAGPERVDRYNGVPPFFETRAYVARIVHDYNRKKTEQEKAAAQTQKKQAAASAKSDARSHARKRRVASDAASSQAASDLPGRSTNSAAQVAANPLSASSPR